MFILSSTSFTQALKRIQYFKDMTSYREQQVNQIHDAQIELAEEKEALIARKQEKLTVQESQEREKNQLLVDAQKQEETVTSLKNKEGDLCRTINGTRFVSCSSIKFYLAIELYFLVKFSFPHEVQPLTFCGRDIYQ